MPTGKVWAKGIGWINKQTTKEAQYDVMGEGWPLFVAFCRFWPDFLADLYRDDEAPFDLSLLQRTILRANARYKSTAITAGRGSTKSFTTDLGELLDMQLWPGITGASFGPSGKQTASIARAIYKQIELCYPMLTASMTVEKDADGGFALSTPFGSAFSVDTFRGNTIHKVIAEETAQEDKNGIFPADKFKENVVPQIRATYSTGGKPNKAYISFKLHSITSAGRRQQYAYELRCQVYRDVVLGNSAFAMDVGYDVVLLCQMRTVEWAEDQRKRVGMIGWPREMESIYSGNEKSPLIPEELIDSARTLLKCENHHCCKDRDNKVKPEDVIYVVGYDVSYRDSKRNAKCAAVVVKLTKQTDFYRKDRYLKQLVWIEDWYPNETPTPTLQAQRVKRIWNRFCYEGSQTYIAIDAWQVGNDVFLSLMSNLGDGLRPLCSYNHMEYQELELEGAIPVVYPIRAGGTGVRDPDSDMIFYAQKQFMYNNVQLLTGNMSEGVEEYKKAHRIKDDSLNYKIAMPYKRTNELVQQLQNLREEPSGTGIKEKRISNHVQRDTWSALKYALRMSENLERVNLRRQAKKNDWSAILDKFKESGPVAAFAQIGSRTSVGRRGGRIY